MWVVRQVETGQEQGVQQALQAMENMVALVPRENRLVRKAGAWTQKEYILFPGYVFLSLDYNADNYYRVRAVPHVLRFLGASGLAPSRLSYLEAEWIKVLSGGGKPLEPTKVRRQPDGSLKVVGGVLGNFASRAIQYDSHARRAKVELTICGEPKTVQLSVELVNDS